MGNILIIEDDTDINNLLFKILKRQNHQVVQAFSGTEGALRLEMGTPELILLDLMLPGLSGETLIEKIRAEMKLDLPIIVLSAKNAIESKVLALKMGADDYMTKPFESEEVLARIDAVLRRYKPSGCLQPETIIYKNLQMNQDLRKVTICHQEISLTPHEYEILSVLIQNPERVYSRESLYEQIWKNGYYGEDNTVNVHVSNIRKKIAAIEPEEEYIKTVWGIGFKMA